MSGIKKYSQKDELTMLLELLTERTGIACGDGIYSIGWYGMGTYLVKLHETLDGAMSEYVLSENLPENLK